MSPKDLPSFFAKCKRSVLFSTSEVSVLTKIPDSTIRASIRYCPDNVLTINGKKWWGHEVAVADAKSRLTKPT